MANEKPAATPAAASPEEKDAPKKKGGMTMMIAAAVVVILEVGTVLVTVKMASGPKQVMAAPAATAPAEKIEKDAEVKLIDAKLPNTQSGRLYLYDLAVVAKVDEKDKDKVAALLTERESEIRDQVRTIIASSDPKSLAEPGLETLRRQISYQLEQDMGKDLLKEILIPKCTPIRAE
jgi:flagellar basal body-associated protein FliL